MTTATAQIEIQETIALLDEVPELPSTANDEIETDNQTIEPTSDVEDVEDVDDTLDKPELLKQEAMVTRATLGDHEAFGEIVDQYSTLMLRTASMIVGDRDIAEDVVQDALIQAWHHLADLRKAGALRPWLMRIVVNQCISFKRRVARTSAFMRQALSDQETDLIAQAADDHKGRMERDWDLAQAIESLPLKQRVVIVLHYYNSMTLPEMSQTLQTSENTLKKRIQAALTNLRRILHASNIEVEADSSGHIPGFAISAA